MDIKTNNDNQRQDLVIRYTGPRGGEYDLVIKAVDWDEELCRQLQDPAYQPEWKMEYLAQLYDEQIRQPNEAKHHRYKADDEAMRKYMYLDASGRVCHIKNGEGKARHSLSGVLQGFELELENREVLNMLLAELTPEQRERTILFYLEGYSYTEIAKMQGVSPTAVRNSINRGFALIRKKYPEHVQKEHFSCLEGEKGKTIPPSRKEVSP